MIISKMFIVSMGIAYICGGIIIYLIQFLTGLESLIIVVILVLFHIFQMGIWIYFWALANRFVGYLDVENKKSTKTILAVVFGIANLYYVGMFI